MVQASLKNFKTINVGVESIFLDSSYFGLFLFYAVSCYGNYERSYKYYSGFNFRLIIYVVCNHSKSKPI